VAQAHLGSLYRTGQGVAQDYREAAKWYLEAANRGNASAQFHLAMMYDKGEGVEQDRVTAYMWYILASVK
jgi:uncharacterized protein